MVSRRVKLTIPTGITTRPVIWELGHRFPVVTNIRRADINEDFGWCILEVTGELHDVDACLDWAASEGVIVSPVVGDVVEG